MRDPFTPPFDRLPDTLPIFPLAGAIVMPGSQLPLNIFEPRYLNMVFDSLGTSRMIGMVQPESASDESGNGAVFGTGTAGRITSFSETGNGRLLIVLTGICRFDIAEEITTTRGYRLAKADWQRFRGDYEPGLAMSADRDHLLQLIRAYFRRHDIDTDWEALEKIDTSLMVNLLIGQLPLDLTDKQALVETVAAEERVKLFTGLLEMETRRSRPSPDTHH
jgi:Lon protease-like protein